MLSYGVSFYKFFHSNLKGFEQLNDVRSVYWECHPGVFGQVEVKFKGQINRI